MYFDWNLEAGSYTLGPVVAPLQDSVINVSAECAFDCL